MILKYRQGHTVSIARSGKVTCPVSITEKVLDLLPPCGNKNLPIVRRIIASKPKERFHEHRAVSYSKIKDDFKKYLRQFVSNTDNFGLHSIKSGAAFNPGCRLLISDILDIHAGWKNLASMNRYIKYTVDDLLLNNSLVGGEESMSRPQPRFSPIRGFFLASLATLLFRV